MWVLYLFSLFLQLLGLLLLVVVLLVVYRFKLRPSPPMVLQKKDWEKDIVYLCAFPFCPKVRSISPFALKLEAWLKLTGIRYENIHTSKFSSKGQMPYIELNGEQIADSNIIIEKLREKFQVDPDKDIPEKDLAMGHAATLMVENHTAQIGFHYRYGFHMQNFLETLKCAEYFPSAKAMKTWGRVQPYITKFRSHLHGIGRHENTDIWEMSFKDLAALSSWLGDNKYFHGTKPTTVDCMLFGHLAQFLYIDIGFPQKTFLEEKCPNLVELVNRMKAELWEDWDESIEQAKPRISKS